MNTRLIPVLLTILTGCASSSPWVPPATTTASEAAVTLVWVGRGECERLEDGKWVRRPEYDYDFSVEQRRLGEHWESVKSMRRRHPDYRGDAGDRVQTYFFHLDFAANPENADALVAEVTSSLGNGTGTSDREFREAQLEFEAQGVSAMAPFDRYRITQHYDYEAGRLTELVELDDGDTPWVRNHETATLFATHRFAEPPSRL
jgi:hypothetical protein